MKNLDKILNKEELLKEDILFLLQLREADKIEMLQKKAEEVRQIYFNDEIHLRGIIEFSNFCIRDCFYCGLRRSNKKVERFRMSKEEIMVTAKLIYDSDIKTIVLQSGEDLFYTKEDIAEIITEIKSQYDVAITLSLGERAFDEYDLWRECGADRYLLKHETANRNLYHQIHPYQDFTNRIAHLKYLKNIGFQIGSGNIIGLPNQTLEDIADDILLCNKLNVDMASFSPFIHADNTPFANVENCDMQLLLNTMAVARLVLKNAHIPATTALATLDEEGREKGILAGANVVMPSFTPTPYRGNYLIYKDKKCISENPKQCMPCLDLRLMSIGVKVSHSHGHSLKT
ncbi:MAG: [FeFe] hydrogenase H-cluster radical SAM maturase HydE [Chlorobi bacterium]|nr:[FeFe] hydrogenase H-cluster radical SAM maturase HydE [Chlorobiota bacterium]